jgi:predicted PurR-regulated permease PerM
MARIISLAVILGLVAVFGLLSLRVMSSFLLPLLLAAMLVVIFGPLHRWLRDRFAWPDWVAAVATTLFVLLLVLVPLVLLVIRAGGDAVAMLRSPNGLKLDPAVLDGLIASVNDATGFHFTSDAVNAELRKLAEEWLGPIAAGTPIVLVKVVIGLIVTILSFFYFLADGRRMLAAVTRLIPLDAHYQWQLLQEFEEVSRAVVSSTLLAAIVQALLAGIGFYVAGLKGVFLLTLLTFFGALVPFVGAAAVWGTASLYLLFFVKDTWSALGLAAWGLLVVSTIDNVIKPIVLHGQSKLHPLLALLSVLGGVGALGPIGIFVGPIAVAFLQAALTMLQTELDTISRTPGVDGSRAPVTDGTAVVPTAAGRVGEGGETARVVPPADPARGTADPIAVAQTAVQRVKSS